MLARTGGIAFLLCLAIVIALPAHAGTMALQWDPVADSDLAGYRIYYGTAHATYTSNIDVGKVTSATLTGLTDCTTWYVGVKAYDLAGNESEAYSNEVSGLPRPTITSVSPSSAARGATLDLTVAGSNFASGATVSLGATGVTVNSVTFTSCSSVKANVTISGSAPTGSTTLDVINADGSFGTSSGLFSISAGSGNPFVSSTNPAAGATGVSTSVHPSVTFSEPMLFASITSLNVRLLNASGKSLAQALGSPSLSPDGKTATITPANPLTTGSTYRIQVIGGPLGVLDLSATGMISTFTETPGFTVSADVTPPTISAVASSNVASTSARITWTTNEAADGQVYYRKSGQVVYQKSPLWRALVTSHTADLQGLLPSTTYQYHVGSGDAAGNRAISTPDQTFVTTSSGYAYFRMEAEAGTLTSPLRIVAGTAFGTAWIDTPAGTPTGTETAPAGKSLLGVNVPTTATWYLWLLLYGVDDSSDSMYETIDGATRRQLTPSPVGEWIWVAGRSLTLTAGLHSIELGGSDAECRADRVILTNDPLFVPTEQAVDDVTPPGKVTSFAGAPASGQVTLSWNNPTDTDFARTIVRYRTDGTYPTTPVDGFLAVDRTGTPGSTASYTHKSLTNGTEYRYSAFALDVWGNVASRTSVRATPNVGLAPPDAPPDSVAEERALTGR
jgi:hypothetical protein